MTCSAGGGAAGPVAILIPAAGASRRMRGADKLLEEVDGEALLRRQVRRALAAGGPVIVCLPPDARTRGAALDGLAVRAVTVPDPSEGMAAAIRAGLAVLPGDALAVMILLPDLPDIESADIAAMIAAFRADPAAPILRATAEDGTPGHPVIFPRRHVAALARATGDAGGRAILQGAADLRAFPLTGRRAVTDLDTPEAWADWRARRQ